MALENIVGYAGAKEIIYNFKFTGDLDRDHINLSNALQRHFDRYTPPKPPAKTSDERTQQVFANNQKRIDKIMRKYR